MPTITLEDMLARRQRNTADAYAHRPIASDLGAALRAKRDTERAEVAAPVPHSFQSAPDGRRAPICEAPDLEPVFAQIADLIARCDALIERNGRWTRYVTGVES